jgi:hypothetical protein
MFLDFNMKGNIFLIGSLAQGDNPPNGIPATACGVSVRKVPERIHDDLSVGAAHGQRWCPLSLAGWDVAACRGSANGSLRFGAAAVCMERRRCKPA